MISYRVLWLPIAVKGCVPLIFTRPPRFRAPFLMLKAVLPFRHPPYPGNLAERIVQSGQHGVTFCYLILTRLNNVSIQLAMTFIP